MTASLGYHKLRPTASVPGSRGRSIPNKIQEASVEDWRMDCPWWLVLTLNPVKRSASLLSLYHVSNDCTNDVKGLEPNTLVCKGHLV